MRIQGLIKRLKEIKEKYGNCEVLTLQQGEYLPPKPSWLFDGARWNLERFSDDFRNKKQIIL